MSAPTELQIASYRNLLTLFGRLRDAVINVNNASKLQLAWTAAIYKDMAGQSWSDGSQRPLAAPLIGFAITQIGKVGDNNEWYDLIIRRVTAGISPIDFVRASYKKSTGSNAPTAPNRCHETRGHHTASSARNFMALCKQRNASHIQPLTSWLSGQRNVMDFTLNDIVSASNDAELQMNNVRVPYPAKFQQWLHDLRDTGITVSGEGNENAIDMYRLFTLTSIKGELVTDFATIVAYINTQINTIQGSQSLPATKTKAAQWLVTSPVHTAPPAPKSPQGIPRLQQKSKMPPAVTGALGIMPVHMPTPAPKPAPAPKPTPAPIQASTPGQNMQTASPVYTVQTTPLPAQAPAAAPAAAPKKKSALPIAAAAAGALYLLAHMG